MTKPKKTTVEKTGKDLTTIETLSLEEKVGFCSGSDFWHLQGSGELGLPAILLADGPHGLKRQIRESAAGERILYPSTCFPTSSAIACSWDPDLVRRIGRAVGRECRADRVSVLLAPGVNIKRSPLCGRNYEYYSEDPLLSGLLGAAMIEGIQNEDVAACLKHFLCNNQETRRMTVNAVVDERALREIYLRPFEIAVKQAKPRLVMCSYNRLNGVYMSENRKMLSGVLRGEWGFDGPVISDWGACNDRVAGIKAGMDIEMPSSCGYNEQRITGAVDTGLLDSEILDRTAARNIDFIRDCADLLDDGGNDFRFDAEDHHALAREAAASSMVLLKNEGILPLNGTGTIAVIGGMAQQPKIQGLGSANILPRRVDSLCEALNERGVSFTYAGGYMENSKRPDPELIAEAVAAAAKVDTVIIVAGLLQSMETEWQDRSDISLPASHNELIKSVLAVNRKTVILLQNGAPVSMPWIEEAGAVLECFLAGEAGGPAAADILFGDINPSGKLAESFPIGTDDCPSSEYFPGDHDNVEYRESIFVGYRYYDAAGRGVLFPFGHGLSYTIFEYSDLIIDKTGDSGFTVSLEITNTGPRGGAEVVQLYVGNNDSAIFKPEKELRGFTKVRLGAGERTRVRFFLDEEAFRYYNPNRDCWQLDPGEYGILIGASSADIRLEETVTVETDVNFTVPDFRRTASAYYALQKGSLRVADEEFEAICGGKLASMRFRPQRKYSLNTTIGEAERKRIGKIFTKIIKQQLVPVITFGNKGLEDSEVERMADMIPFRMIVMMGGNLVSPLVIEGIIEMLNGRLIKGFRMIKKGGKEKK